MHEYLIAHGVLGLLTVSTITVMGLLGLWAAVSQWPWYARAATIVGLLSPLLLRPMYEVFATLLTQVIVIVIGIKLYRSRGALWDTLRGKRKLSRPQFNMSSLLAMIGLAGVAAAVAAAMLRHLDLVSFYYPLPFGAVAGATTLLAAWWSTHCRWTSRLFSLMLLIPLVFAFQHFDYLRELAPYTRYWPYGSDAAITPEDLERLRASCFVLAAIVVQFAMIVAWRRAVRPAEGSWPQRRLLVATMATLLLTLLPLYVFARLQFPYPIPQLLVLEGDDAAFQQLLALADRFKKTTVWTEICKDPVDEERLAIAVHKHAAEYQELHELFNQSTRRPMSLKWIADAKTSSGNPAFKAALDELMHFSTIINVLDAEADSARREGATDAAIQGSLGMVRLAATTSRGVDFSSYLRADTFLQMGLENIYLSLPSLDESQCELCLFRLEEMTRHQPSITQLLEYERAAWENGEGWTGHLMRVLGDLSNRIDPSLDAHYEGFLRRLDYRSQATTRLLIVELMLRHFHLRNGKYPQSLDQLSIEAFQTSPNDLFGVNGDRFVYHKVDEGYVLYSPGTDGDDDGGRPAARNSYGTPDNLYGDGDIQLKTHFAEEAIDNQDDS